MSKPALGPTYHTIQLLREAFNTGLKRSGREADHSPPSNGEVKNEWSYASTPPVAGCLVKHRHNFTFTFTFTIYCVQNDSESPPRVLYVAQLETFRAG
jgi:hypothetical protein